MKLFQRLWVTAWTWLIVAIATLYLWVVPISYGPSGIIQVASSAYNALGRPIPAVVMTVTCTFVLHIPLAYLGGRWLGPLGVFGAATLANSVVGIGAYWWSRRIHQEKVVQLT